MHKERHRIQAKMRKKTITLTIVDQLAESKEDAASLKGGRIDTQMITTNKEVSEKEEVEKIKK